MEKIAPHESARDQTTGKSHCIVVMMLFEFKKLIDECLIMLKSRPHIRTENGNTLTEHINRNLCHSVIIVVNSQYLAFLHQKRVE